MDMRPEWAIVYVTIAGIAVTLIIIFLTGLVGYGKVTARFDEVEKDVLLLISVPTVLSTLDLRFKTMEALVARIELTMQNCEGCTGRSDVRLADLAKGQDEIANRQIKQLEGLASLSIQVADTNNAMTRIHATMLALAAERRAGEDSERGVPEKKR